MPCLPALPAGQQASCRPWAKLHACCKQPALLWASAILLNPSSAAACLLQAAAPPPRAPEPHAKAEEQAPPPTPEMLTPADLQRKVTLHLEETETVWLLQLTGGCVNQETPEGKAVSAANTRCACAAVPRSKLGVSADLPWLLPVRLSAGVLRLLLFA